MNPRHRIIRTLEHKSGVLRVLAAGTTEFSKKPFLRCEMPQAGFAGRTRLAAIMLDDADWISETCDVQKMWKEFREDRKCLRNK